MTSLPAGRVRLEQLREEHAPDLFTAICTPDVWAYIPKVRPADVSAMRAYIASALEAQRLGTEIAVAMVDSATGKAIGTSRFTDISPAHRQLEIGWTMIAPSHQRTSANTEVKLMMLSFAFEHIRFASATGCVRVQLKCDHRNLRSQAAIQRIGAQFEGRLRRHRILPDGFIRDTMFYSILDSEWPGVKTKLMQMLAQPR